MKEGEVGMAGWRREEECVEEGSLPLSFLSLPAPPPPGGASTFYVSQKNPPEREKERKKRRRRGRERRKKFKKGALDL